MSLIANPGEEWVADVTAGHLIFPGVITIPSPALFPIPMLSAQFFIMTTQSRLKCDIGSHASVNISSYLKSYHALFSYLSALVLLTNIYSLFQLLSNLYIVLKLTVYLSLLVN